MPSQTEDEVARRLGGLQVVDVVSGVVESHSIGHLVDFQLINVGFEDCNIAVQTSSGRYVAKVFAFDRAGGLAERTVGIIEAAMTAGVEHPAVLRSPDGSTLQHLDESGLAFLVMEEIQGASFYGLGRCPSVDELAQLVAELAKLHRSLHRPAYLLDPWAVPNLERLYAQVRPALSHRDDSAVAATLGEMGELSTPLPEALIHGDVTKGNVLLASDGGIYLIDYASANRWPRIQELAVMAANLMHGSDLNLDDRARLLAELYRANAELNEHEIHALKAYARAAASMELIGAVYEQHVKGNDSAETALVYEIGASALHSVN